MKKLSLPLIAIAAVFLSACTPSPESLAEDKELFDKVTKECLDLGSKAQEEQKCKNLAEAVKLKAKSALDSITG